MGRCHRLVVLALLLSVLPPAPSRTQPLTLAELEQLFETDPAQAFVEAERMFEEPEADGDLDEMMDIIRLVADRSKHCFYYAVVEDMFDAAIPLAEAKGHWAALGELYTSRGRLLISATYYPSGMDALPIYLRSARFADLATAAFEKAGESSEDLSQLKWELNDYVDPEHRAEQLAKRLELREQRFAAEFVPLLTAVDSAIAEARDDDALDHMEEIVDLFEADPLLRGSDHLMAEVRGRLWLRGSERFLPALRQIVDTPTAEGQRRWKMYEALLDGCWILWSGLDDDAYRTQYWCLEHLYANPEWYERGGPRLIQKASGFRRFSEADRLTRGYIARLQSLGLPSGPSLWCLHEATPPDLRRAIVEMWLMGKKFPASPSSLYWALHRTAPPDQKQLWYYETGLQIMHYLSEIEDLGHKSNAARDAGRLFHAADRPELAEQANALAEQLEAQAPAAVAQSALATAQVAAREERWQDVIATLKPRLADVEAGSSLVNAHVLLATACRRLEDLEAATVWFQRARELVRGLDLSAGERINHLMSLATVAEDSSSKLSLLDEAHAVADQAGLSMLAEQVANQRASLGLEEGDLPAARDALIAVIDRTEERRQRLAFDPRLRQEWFADNIGPYRQLMRVAALQADAGLALACGERMRSRVLLDQLAWRKVDMAVRLPEALRQRLVELRNMRREAYGLLAQVMGGGETPSGDTDHRGLYMPIRGLYMPIRGPLDSGEAATEADVQRLRGLLDDLAAEEAALASAIREQVPAYARASQVTIPSGEALVAEVARHAGLAVLHYTFADEGLVVVGACGGDLRVRLIEADREALYQQIGRLREAIWERTDEAYGLAAALYKTLVQPAEGVLAGADRLWIVADGAVQLVPFAALIDGRNRYLGARMPIAFAPSLTLALSSRGEREAASREAVVVAAPETGASQITFPEGDDGRGLYMPIRGMYMPIRGSYMPIRGEGVSSALTAMAMVPLPEAKAEGDAVASRFDDTVLLSGAEATKSRLSEVGGDCDVLHIATHGYADPDFSDFSGLLLAAPEGGETAYEVLTASEVYGWPLTARLVTLSACQTALGRDVEGEGILGLSRAFIYAGAQDVVCSLWPVSDESTRELMTAFYEALSEGAMVEKALQRGQNALPQTGDKAHPFYWAGFIAVRGPG
ncbi:MAG: CHAT domain-containing protein [Armatimonadota bacterium]|nr:CHAT domain-containing protein [Armatimonadota bacterium]